MTRRDTILTFLGTAHGPICDDCLSARTKISPRQSIFQTCTLLASAGRLSRDRYADCAYCRRSKICNSARPISSIPATSPPDQTIASIAANTAHRPWHWEGHVQDFFVTWLRVQGWAILQTADTASKAVGMDVIAAKEGREMWVSVKGYPSGTEKTNPSTQARHWFSHAIFDMVRYRDESDTAELAIALPAAYTTYHALASRVRWLRKNLPFTLFWVAQDGSVQQE